MNELKLGGDKSRCSACGLYFKSTHAFDKHRTGSFRKNDRRCLSIDEMTAKGMETNARGYWVGSRRWIQGMPIPASPNDGISGAG